MLTFKGLFIEDFGETVPINNLDQHQWVVVHYVYSQLRAFEGEHLKLRILALMPRLQGLGFTFRAS